MQNIDKELEIPIVHCDSYDQRIEVIFHEGYCEFLLRVNYFPLSGEEGEIVVLPRDELERIIDETKKFLSENQSYGA